MTLSGSEQSNRPKQHSGSRPDVVWGTTSAFRIPGVNGEVIEGAGGGGEWPLRVASCSGLAGLRGDDDARDVELGTFAGAHWFGAHCCGAHCCGAHCGAHCCGGIVCRWCPF
jgi:hypothetical protein